MVRIEGIGAAAAMVVVYLFVFGDVFCSVEVEPEGFVVDFDVELAAVDDDAVDGDAFGGALDKGYLDIWADDCFIEGGDGGGLRGDGSGWGCLGGGGGQKQEEGEDGVY